MSLLKLVTLAKNVLNNASSKYTGLDALEQKETREEKAADVKLEQAIFALDTESSDAISKKVVAILRGLVKYKQDQKTSEDIEKSIAAFESEHGEYRLTGFYAATPNNTFTAEAREFIRSIRLQQSEEVTADSEHKAVPAVELKEETRPSKNSDIKEFIDGFAECINLELAFEDSFNKCSSKIVLSAAHSQLAGIFTKTLQKDIAAKELVSVKLDDIEYKPSARLPESSMLPSMFSKCRRPQKATDTSRDDFFAIATEMTQYFKSEKMTALRKMAIERVSQETINALTMLSDRMNRMALEAVALKQKTAAQKQEESSTINDMMAISFSQ